MIDCEKIREALNEIKRMYERFSVLMDRAKESRDYSELHPLKIRIKDKIGEMNESLDSFDILLRKKIGRKYKAYCVSEFINDLAVVNKKPNAGFIIVNRQGEVVVGQDREEFKGMPYVEFARRGGLVVAEARGRTFLFNRNGENLFPEEKDGFEYITYNDFLGVFGVKKLRGFVQVFRWENGSLNEITGLRDDALRARAVSEDIGRSPTSGHLYDKNGQLILKQEVSSLHELTVAAKGPIAVRLTNGEDRFYDRNQNPISNEFLTGVTSVKSMGDYLSVGKEDKAFLVGEDGENLFKGGDFEDGVDGVYDFADGIAKVRKGKRYFYVDGDGQNILHGHLKQGVMDDSTQFADGRAVTGLAGTWAVIDKKGNVIKTFKKDCEVTGIHRGFIQMKRDGKIFFLTADGEDFMKDGDFADGVEDSGNILYGKRIVVKKGERWFLMDSRGKNVLAGTEFSDGFKDQIHHYAGVFNVELENQKTVFFDKNGRRLFNYDK